jgi:hypothetical protein
MLEYEALTSQGMTRRWDEHRFPWWAAAPSWQPDFVPPSEVVVSGTRVSDGSPPSICFAAS